jgi:hypothetical protein
LGIIIYSESPLKTYRPYNFKTIFAHVTQITKDPTDFLVSAENKYSVMAALPNIQPKTTIRTAKKEQIERNYLLAKIKSSQ